MRRVLAASLLAALCAGPVFSGPAAAAQAAPGPRVPVLVLDAGLGDSPLWISQWLGDAVGEQRTGSSVRLWRAKAPKWWEAGEAPATYVLSSSTTTGGPAPGAISVADIAWALDRVTASDARLKALLVAQGVAGLQARAYLQDAGQPRYSGREDVVGLVEIGTPNEGLAMAQRYPRLDVWGAAAEGAGLTSADLLPGSQFIARLNAARPIPATCRVAVVRGLGGRAGGYESDGIVAKSDSRLATAVASDVVYTDTRSRGSDGWSLTRSWGVLTPRGGATTETIDEQPVEQLGFLRGYPADTDVADAVKKLYTAWYSNGVPTTHISSRLVVDVSGSMAAAWSGTTKLDGARRAAAGFASALKARTSLPGATPEDLGLVLFSTNAELVLKPQADPSPVASLLAKVSPKSYTDVGAALTTAVDSFALTPRSADKVVVLLSDGLPTTGMDKNAILLGPVAAAKKAAVRVDTIALGQVADADTGFLAETARQTGGSFRQANDVFQLRRDFLRARFASLGKLLVDKEMKGPQRVAVAKASSTTRRIEAAVVTDGNGGALKVLRDGVPVPKASYETRATDAVFLVSMKRPAEGSYSIEVSGLPAGQRIHVFAVQDADVFTDTGTAAAPDDSGMLMLVAVAGALVLGVAVTILVSLRGRGQRPVEETK